MIRSALGNGLSLLLLFAAALAWLSAMVLQPQPMVAPKAQFSSADADRARRLITNSFRQQAGNDRPQRLDLTQSELQLLTDYLLSRLPPATGNISLQPGWLTFQASTPVPPPGAKRHLNLSLQLRQSGSGLQLARLSIGDLARHFAGSAALAALGSRPLADATGLFKELEDSRQGSGFSFRDLAADLAGARFGQLATASEAAAGYLRQQLDHGLRTRDLMPNIHDLPERLGQSEFERRFGGIGGSGYLKTRDMIEQRIENCTLYRQF